jgi:hypothetical protein
METILPNTRQPNANTPAKNAPCVLSDATMPLKSAKRDASDGQKTPAQYVSRLKE